MKAQDKQLLEIFRRLDATGRESLFAFAQFLDSRNESVSTPLPEPELIAPKEGETVVGALKRLSQSYPMLDKSKMLNETSLLVSQHVMQGRDKAEVIEELEVVFMNHYQRLKESRE